ncbi:heterokaryon incompatibility protein-domain-containing protein [Rhexocercosporidium sp. MPI-PUGE-AT-0058]|nr:heterokaryon incompatibility protein-domain-containing protein [Rhexocercosporidium sp. MPI-PUGE-AT-0058]
MTELYQYTPLPEGKYIRLLHLEPGRKSDPGHCQLTTVKLDDAPPFEALSYHWGSAQLSYSITINNKGALNLTSNLVSALIRVRHETELRVLWADAICINQENIKERTEQVQLMSEIYGRASQVLIYLGAGTNDLPVAVSLIMKMFNLALEENRTGDGERVVQNRYPSAKDNEEWGLPPFDSPDWECLMRFFGRSWFERVWIVQEVRVSSSALALIGDYEIAWMIIYIASSWFATKNYKYLPSGSGIYAGHIGIVGWPNRIGCHKLNADSSFRVPLNQIIRKMRPSKATDPRDKIFGFLGLAAEAEGSEDSRLKPDYSKSLERTYRDASRFLIETERSLQILSAVCWVPDPRSPLVWTRSSIKTEYGTETTSKLEWGPPDESIVFPSWVPRWDCPNIAYPLVGRSDHETFFHASADIPLGLLSSADENALIVRGMEIDIVMQQSDIPSSKLIGYESFQTTLDRAWVEMGSKATMYPEMDRLNIFHLTLTAGMTLNYKEAERDAGYQENVSAFRKKMPSYRGGKRISQAEDHESAELSGTQDEQNKDHLDETSMEIPDVDIINNLRGDPDVYLRLVEEYCRHRRFFVTEKGYMGLGPQAMLPGDTISILFGGDTPYALRKKEKCWQFVGECYVHGVMKGEAVRDLERRDDEGEVFEIR